MEDIAKVYIGKRESDILTTNYFDYSITYYGSNSNNNFAYSRIYRNSNNYTECFIEFSIHYLEEILHFYNNLEIQVYTIAIARKILSKKPDYKNFFRTLNSFKVIDWLNDKFYTRFWLSNVVDIAPTMVLSKNECRINQLENFFEKKGSFVLQKSVSSGSKGTFILNKDTQNELISKLPNIPYIVSPFFDYYSCSCHTIIGNDEIIIFPSSIQNISFEKEKTLYHGSDYYKFQKELKKKENLVYSFIYRIGKKLQEIGFRGVCGMDFLVSEKEIIFIEINPRFQGSSFLINYFLKKEKLPDLFELNLDAFNKHNPLLHKFKNEIEHLYIPAKCEYSTFKNTQDFKCKATQKQIIYNDGLENVKCFEENVYLYRVIKFFE